LSPNQLIITGDKESINTLAKSFENDNITADFLPFAIPYHTPLVSGVVSLSNPDIQALQITNPLIESWSCSLAAPYPAQSEEIRKMTTNLFSKPILFRESIEALYKKGVRTFIEVGPRGNLAPVISEILNERPHTSLAANRSDIAAITQLHHVLAALFTNAVYMDLAYLYARRSPILLSIDKISSFNPLTERLGKEQSLAKTLYTSNQTVQKRNISLENVRGEITTIDQAIVALSDSFQNQLEQLERQVMSHFNAQKVYRLDNEGNGRRSHYLSQEIILKNTFTDIGDDLCAAIVCRQVRVDTLPDKEAELFSLANSLLTPAEISIFSSFRQLSKRKEWLAGRIAAKEATKTLVQKPSGKAIDYMDMQIDCLPSGKPYLNVNNEMHKYPISITHKDGQVIAVAADGSKLSSIGIDLESLILDDGLENFILNATERKYIEHLSGQERSYYIKCIWSAKEATAKALGLGLSDCLTKLSIADEIYGKNQFSIDCSAARSEKANEFIKVHIGVLDNMIISLVAGDI
jgi:phosphopantetheinyl transferase (holo-ACP synthase)